MQSQAKTVADYLAELPEERRETIARVREVVLANLAEGFEEGMQYGMIGYYVPHSVFPAGYHCDPREPLPFAALAAQKNHYAIYGFCLYSDEKLLAWFTSEWARTGLKLDMGKSCIRFRKLEKLPLELIGRLVGKVSMREYIDHYLSLREGR